MGNLAIYLCGVTTGLWIGVCVLALVLYWDKR